MTYMARFFSAREVGSTGLVNTVHACEEVLMKGAKNLPICHSRGSGNPVITHGYGFPIRPAFGYDRGSEVTKQQKFGLFTRPSDLTA